MTLIAVKTALEKIPSYFFSSHKNSSSNMVKSKVSQYFGPPGQPLPLLREQSSKRKRDHDAAGWDH